MFHGKSCIPIIGKILTYHTFLQNIIKPMTLNREINDCTVLYRVLQPSSVPRIYMPTCFLLLVLPSMIYDGTNSFVVWNENTCFPVKPIEEYTYLNVQYIIYNKRSSPIQKWLCISLYTHTKQLLFSFTYNPTSHTIFPNYTVHCHCTLCACQPYC